MREEAEKKNGMGENPEGGSKKAIFCPRARGKTCQRTEEKTIGKTVMKKLYSSYHPEGRPKDHSNYRTPKKEV